MSVNPARQKMINMLYLVYTALLALEVAQAILKAFVKVNTGLVITVQNFEQKNKALYNNFDLALSQNKAKTQKYYDAAQKVKKDADDLYQFINKLKAKTMSMTTGDPLSKFIAMDKKLGVDTVMNLKNYQGSLEDYEHPIRAFGLERPEKPKHTKDGIDGLNLMKNMKDYRNSLTKILTDFGAGKGNIANSVKQTFAMKDMKEEDMTVSWITGNFYHTPMAAVITMLSKIQGDVRNTETSVVTYLYSQVGAHDIKVNHIDAIVTSPSNYVFLGDTFRGKVFLAAYDTTQVPKVYYSSTWDSTKKPTEQMTGTIDSAKIKGGAGILNIPASAQGTFTYHGLLNIKGPDGITRKYPWHTTYQVAQSSVTISPTKMNVFYIGVDNPVSISAPGVPADAVQPHISNGSIRHGKKGSWIVRVTRPGKAVVSVSAKINGQNKSLGKMDFRVKRIPDPVPYVGGKTGSSAIKIAQLKYTTFVQAKMENFDFDVKVRVIGFHFETTVHGVLVPVTTQSRYFDSRIKKIISHATRGQRMYFEDIKVKMPDGTVRTVAPVNLKCL